MFLMGIKMWWVRRFIAPIWNVPTEAEICFAFGRHVSDRFRVVGGADPYSKHFNGFVGERLAAPAAGGWIMKHVV